MNMVQGWIQRHLSNPQIVSLTLVLLASILLVTYFGTTLAPFFAAIVLAYLLEGPVAGLERSAVSRGIATVLVWLVFVAIVLVVLFAIIPLVTAQLAQAVQELPGLVLSLQQYLHTLPERYPQVVSPAQIDDLLGQINGVMVELRNVVLARSWLVGVGLIYFAVYLVLVPLLVFFLLKDKPGILAWGRRFLPEDMSLIQHVWGDVDRQLGNYVRGKAVEIIIVGSFAWMVFSLFGLNYALLLATLTGVSVLVPYLGALVVTLPVALVAAAQWGVGSEMAWVVFAYGVIQALDGNVLVPVLFSEAVDLHPVAIIVAVLFFGGIWGFWGVFFAIPLATVVNAVIQAWPQAKQAESAANATPESEATAEDTADTAVQNPGISA